MDRSDLLKKIASDYEEILQNVSKKLKDVKDLAKAEGLFLDGKKEEVRFATPALSVKNDIAVQFEKQKQVLLDQMNKIKEEAQRQAKSAMEEASVMRASVPSIPTIPMTPTMQMDLGDISETSVVAPEAVEKKIDAVVDAKDSGQVE